MTLTGSDTMIPVQKQPAVERALVEAFGVKEVEDIHPMTAGLSTALVYRIVVKGKPYLLRVITRTDDAADPTHQYACMRAAAEAGIAPRIWYASVEDRLLISDFVEAQPFPEDMALRMAPLLNTLHGLPGFPKSVNYLDFIDGSIRRFQAANILPESHTEDVFSRYAEVTRVYPRNDEELVASHNDLKPQNIVFDGERVWLIDWEAVFLNDRYIDLAVVANFFVKNEADEIDYLEAYFGESVSEYQRARFYLMRQSMHMSYMTFLLLLVSRTGLAIDPNRPVPDFREFHERLITNEADLAYDEVRLDYALVHLDALKRNLQSQRFEDAVALVGSVTE